MPKNKPKQLIYMLKQIAYCDLRYGYYIDRKIDNITFRMAHWDKKKVEAYVIKRYYRLRYAPSTTLKGKKTIKQ